MSYSPPNTDVKVSGSITVADTGSTTASGYLNQNVITGTPTASSFIQLQIQTASSVTFAVSGNLSGTLVFERSVDGVQWAQFGCFPANTPNTTTNIVSTGGTTGQGDFHGLLASHGYARIRCSAFTSGTATINIQASPSTGTVSVNSPIRVMGPDGTVSAVKAASIAPVATDPALVTTKSPNSPDVTSLSTIATNTNGLATASAQTTGNNSLSTIVTNTGRIPALGQVASTSSSPVVIASDQTAIPANSGFLNLAQTSVAVANGDLVPQTDVSLYMWASLHVTGTFSGTYTFQGTNELTPTNWVAIPALQRATGQPASTTTGGASNVIWDIPTPFRWLRVRMTTYSSGTAVGNAYLSGQNNQMMSTTAFVTQSGTWTAIPSPSTASGGLLSFNNAAIIALTVVKSSTARVHRIMIQNPNTSAAWLQVFNSATTAAVTLGTTVPLYPVYIPAGGYFEDYFNFSDGFTNGCTIAATTTAYGSTAVTTGLVVSLGYI